MVDVDVGLHHPPTYATWPRSLAGITLIPPNRLRIVEVRVRAGSSISSIATLPVTPVTSHGVSCRSSSASGSAPRSTSSRATATRSFVEASSSGVRSCSSRVSRSAPARIASAAASASPARAAASSAPVGSRSARAPLGCRGSARAMSSYPRDLACCDRARSRPRPVRW